MGILRVTSGYPEVLSELLIAAMVAELLKPVVSVAASKP